MAAVHFPWNSWVAQLFNAKYYIWFLVSGL